MIQERDAIATKTCEQTHSALIIAGDFMFVAMVAVCT